MAYDPTLKRYAKDLGVPVPNVEFCPTEFPRLHTFPAPYLPLGLENERHDEHYVVLTGKVVALDSLGFLVPAGLAIQLENAARTAEDWDDPTYTRYTAADVAAGVKNARGVLCVLNEPVVRSLRTTLSASGEENLLTGNVPVAAAALTIGDHIGVASYSWLRASSDALDRSGMTPKDPSELRHMAWEPQLASKTVRTNYCLEYPRVANRDNVALAGQACAIGSFVLGQRVTFDTNSDIVAYADPTVGAIAAANAAEPTAAEIGAAITAALALIGPSRNRIVGQVVKTNTRVPSSALDKVRSKWESGVQGFGQLDRMPGSATGGKAWNLHTAGADDSIVVSLFMR